MMENWLTARVKARPDAIALIDGAQQWTYSELNTLVDRCAANLGASVTAGAHVGVLLPNGYAYVVVIHALLRLGAVIVPLNTRLTDSEIAWQLQHTGCKVVIGEAPESSEWAVLPVDELLRESGAPHIPPCPVDLAAPLAIVFTSGTTGHPKGAVLTYGNFFYSAMASAYRLGVLPDDRWLCILPLYHVGGLSIILRSCLYGTTIDLYHKFDGNTLNQALSTQPITLISLVPTMLYRLLEE